MTRVERLKTLPVSDPWLIEHADQITWHGSLTPLTFKAEHRDVWATKDDAFDCHICSYVGRHRA